MGHGLPAGRPLALGPHRYEEGRVAVTGRSPPDRHDPEGRGTDSKTRLVRLYPKRLAWTNTHVRGSSRHSQFLYELAPSGRGTSRLEFTGLQLLRLARRPSARATATLGRTLAREDAALWRVLARAMARDLGARRARRSSH